MNIEREFSHLRAVSELGQFSLAVPTCWLLLADDEKQLCVV